MENTVFLDLNYVPRYISSSKKKFATGERHVTRFGTQNIILLVLDGVLRFEENGKEVVIGSGEYYVQMAGKHQSGNLPSESPEYIFINFTGRFTKRAGRSLALRGNFDIERIEVLYTRLKECEEQFRVREDLNIWFERQVLFFDILNALHKKNIGLQQKQSVAGEIYDYINLHFFERITLQTLSGQFGYSRDHIIRVFKSAYMITPYQHLAYCRICHAKLLLGSEEEIPVTKVALACGYSDYTAFYHAFLHAEGKTPTAFRQYVLSQEHENKETL